MSAVLVNFPKRFRTPLPNDAIPLRRESHVAVFPHDGGWAFTQQDDGGGEFAFGLTKDQAISRALHHVTVYRATMSISNEEEML